MHFSNRRLIPVVPLLAFGLALQGCVSARHYEEARSVAESETAAHGRTRARLEAAVKRIHELEADLEKQQKVLAERDSAVAQSKLDTTVAQKEREAATELVEQLRAELARTGDHLTSFSREKQELTQSLLVAEQRMQSIELAGKNLGELVATTRDLALLLEEPLAKRSVELGAKDGQVVVSMASERLFAPRGDALLADAAPVLEAVSKVSASHPALKIVVREPACAELGAARATRLGEALRERGVSAGRLTLPAAKLDQRSPAAESAAKDGVEVDVSAESGDVKAAVANADRAPKVSEKTEKAEIPAVDERSTRYEIAFTL